MITTKYNDPIIITELLSKKAIESCVFKVHNFSEYVYNAELEQISSTVNAIELGKIENYQYKGIPVGEHAYAGALRFYTRSTLKGTKDNVTARKVNNIENILYMLFLKGSIFTLVQNIPHK